MGPVPYTGMGSGTGPYKERDIWGQAVHRKGVWARSLHRNGYLGTAVHMKGHLGHGLRQGVSLRPGPYKGRDIWG